MATPIKSVAPIAKTTRFMGQMVAAPEPPPPAPRPPAPPTAFEVPRFVGTLNLVIGFREKNAGIPEVLLMTHSFPEAIEAARTAVGFAETRIIPQFAVRYIRRFQFDQPAEKPPKVLSKG